MRLLVLVVLALLMAGCAEVPTTEYRMSGSFTSDRTNADLDEFQTIVEPYAGGSVALMESFPEQFSFAVVKGNCLELQSLLGAKSYVASATCREI